MKTSPILIAALALVAIGSSVLAWKEYQELIPLRASALDSKERENLRKAAWDAQKRASSLEDQLKRRGAATADLAGSDRPRSALGDVTSAILSRMDDPEIRRLMEIEQKAALTRRYAAFFRTLNLPPAQLDHLKDLLLEKQNVQMDVLMAASEQGINPMQNPDEFKKMVADSQAEVDAKIQSDLGGDQYAQLQNFQNTQAQRGVVNQLRSDLSFTDAPLSETQADQMVQILSQGSTPSAASESRAGPGGAGGGPLVTDATISLSQSVLAPAQVQALRDIQQQQQANAQMQKLMFQAQDSGAAGAGAAPASGQN